MIYKFINQEETTDDEEKDEEDSCGCKSPDCDTCE